MKTKSGGYTVTYHVVDQAGNEAKSNHPVGFC